MRKPWTRRRFLAAAGASTAAGLAFGQRRARGATSAPALTRRERATLRAFADEIIPAADGMPAASEVGAVSYLEALAARDEDVRRQLRAAAAALDAGAQSAEGRSLPGLGREARVAVITRLERSAADTFATARNLVYEGYYTQQQVTKRLGFDFVPIDRPAPPLEPFDERLLERVKRMPPLHRQVR
jgi:hypothetical protein